jgi:biopolymer transport protein ExbD
MAAKLSGSGGGKYDIGQNNEINVTPFVDVMLVLLIIFMVAAPLSTVSVEVKLPDAYAKPQQNPSKPIYISIQKNGNMYIGDYPTSLDAIGDDLKKQLPAGKRAGDERIFIRGDGDTLYLNFLQVMNKLQDNGYYSVALIGADAATKAH